MNLQVNFKLRSALAKQQKGDYDGAKAIYEELYQKGVVQASYMLPWSVLLLREGGDANYIKVKEVLVKAQKASDITEERRQQLIMNFAVATWKTGNHEKALSLLEQSHSKLPRGDTYGTLGYLYIEAGDAEKALAFNLQAMDYDDEDPITLDNLGQTYYRLLHDKVKAKECFDKAIKIKPGQIDTLWFLSRYDLEDGNTAAALEKLKTALEGRFSPLNHVTKEEIEKEITRLE